MSDMLLIAVVGHTNAGKTSLLRTLIRNAAFGEVSGRPGTTRHVEYFDVRIDGQITIRLFDTPGLEDSIALLEYMNGLGPRQNQLENIHAFLDGPEARGKYEQEAKVLRQMLQVDAALYVIDSREAVLPKFQDELVILAACAKPILPVLNFVASNDVRKQEWANALTRHGLHAQIAFDAVAPMAGGERLLYKSLSILLGAYHDKLESLIKALEAEAHNRRKAGARLIAELLVDVSSYRRAVPASDNDKTELKQQLVTVQDLVRNREQECVDHLLKVYRFTSKDVEFTALPLLNGRWKDDLFSPETLRIAGIKLGMAAAIGTGVGLLADIAVAGVSLGAGAAAGGAIGGSVYQAWRNYGNRIAAKLKGYVELTVDDPILRLLIVRQCLLLRSLEMRGHAAQHSLVLSETQTTSAESSKAVTKALSKARSHPEWSRLDKTAFADDADRSQFIEEIAMDVLSLLDNAVAPQTGETNPREG